MNIYTQQILEAVRNTTNNIQVEAVAGSGKTTTLIEIAKARPQDRILVACFNSSIAEEAKGKYPTNCTCKTLHKAGVDILSQNGHWFKINERKVDNLLRYEICNYDTKSQWARATKADKELYYNLKWDLLSVVGMAKRWGIFDEDSLSAQMPELIRFCKVDVEDMNGFRLLAITLYGLDRQKEHTIDFDDMILMPQRLGMPFPEYDLLLVDEAQDLNRCQREFIKQFNCRVIVVGDSHQSIYGFTGADPSSLDKFEEEFETTKLPLSLTYRCSKAVTQRAKNINPLIECNETAPDGIVAQINEEYLLTNVTSGDMVLCRTNAPLVELAIKLYKKGYNLRLFIDYPYAELIYLIQDIQRTCKLVTPEVINRWSAERLATLKDQKKFYQASELEEKLQILEMLSHDCKEARDYIQKINQIFTMSPIGGITLSTIHKMKGSEATNVWLIRPDLLPHPKAETNDELRQESNLEYVAITRAKLNYFVVNTPVEGTYGE